MREGQAGSVMCSYNRINGVYACENPTTLTTILKHQFGFDGFVISDWGGTHSTVAAANAGPRHGDEPLARARTSPRR